MSANMQNSPHPIFPSILSTDFFNLESRLTSFQSNGIDYIHLDIMDGHFVENLSFGPSAVTAIKSKFPFKVDSHLMVDRPDKMIPWFIDGGSDWVSFHVEIDGGTNDNIAYIKEHDCRAGLVLNPDTDVEKVFPYLESIDYVLLMSVFPGYGGQAFITATIDRAARLKQQITAVNPQCLIQVDGGVNASNAGSLKNAGTDLFVIGTFIFNSQDIGKTINLVLNNLNENGV
ncbi:MAG: ribulose-phosphate 3-epimerase [bacterium]|nr:ribulose-phosphate 3-epimerase [bacterium]